MRRVDEVEADRPVFERISYLKCTVAQRLGLGVGVN